MDDPNSVSSVSGVEWGLLERWVGDLPLRCVLGDIVGSQPFGKVIMNARIRDLRLGRKV
jgi:hypothetical protein